MADSPPEVWFRDAADEIVDLLTKKNHDYGDDNLRQDGRYGILVRVSDKVSRLRHMLKGKEVKISESERDAWVDIAGYAIQAIRFLDQERALLKEKSSG